MSSIALPRTDWRSILREIVNQRRMAFSLSSPLAARGQVSGPLGAAAGGATTPQYWIEFDGSNDYVLLPAGEGSEPSTAITIETWFKTPADIGGFRFLVTRGSDYNVKGYSLMVHQVATSFRIYFLLKGPLNANTYADFPNSYFANSEPGVAMHIACSWDGAFLYYFVNGVLIKKTVSDATPITYTGTQWAIGMSSLGFGFCKGGISLLRVSNSCRYTASFTPPTDHTSDANTVCLYKMTEGSGTTLADSGPGGHNGTFKGAGEPVWGVQNTYSMSIDSDLWDRLLAATPAITDVNVYAKKTDNAYGVYVYRKLHATGPTWLRYKIENVFPVMLNTYSIVPTPANDVPSSWASEAETKLTTVGDTEQELALTGTPTGGISASMGGIVHGNEVVDSVAYDFDGTPWTPGVGDWNNGTVFHQRVNSHFINPGLPGVPVASVIRDTYLSALLQYVRLNIQITWNVTFTSIMQYGRMLGFNVALFPTATFIYGGTDYTVASGEQGHWKCNTAAVWNAANEYIAALHFPDVPNALFNYPGGQRFFVNNKLYPYIYNTLDKAKAGDVWNLDGYWLFLANAGNHFLKTS